MDAIQAIKTRRSVRKYSGEDIPEEILTEILDCARLTPSGHNKQPWKFVVIKKAETRREISELARYGRFIKDVPVCLAVFCSPVPDTYKEDAFAATENILLAAHAHDLGSCWVDSHKKEHSAGVEKLLNCPDDLELMSLIAIGKGEQPPCPRKKTLEDIVVRERFS